jgi:HEXXH motif-containing protein
MTTLPSFVAATDLVEATRRLVEAECRALWERLRPYVARESAALAAGLDELVARGVPDTAKVRHFAFVSRHLLRSLAYGRDLESMALSHFVVDGLAPGRLLQLHALRLLEALLAAVLAPGAARAPFTLRLDDVPAPSVWDLGIAGGLRAPTAGPGFTLRLDPRGLILDAGGPLVTRALPGGASLSVDARYAHAPALLVGDDGGSARAFIHLPIHDRGLREPYAASAPIVRDPHVAAAWAMVLGRAVELARAADPALTDESLLFAREALPLYHGRGQLFASASNPDVLGYVYLPAVETAVDVAECFVHEAMHQKLFRLEACAPLFAPESPSEEAFYSPWRPDPRPLRMVLHGCFVFALVAHLWRRWATIELADLPGRARAHELAFRRCAEVLAGVALLRRYALFTRHGARLVDEIEALTRAILDELSISDGTRAEVNAALAAHRQRHVGRSRCSDPITF